MDSTENEDEKAKLGSPIDVKDDVAENDDETTDIRTKDATFKPVPTSSKSEVGDSLQQKPEYDNDKQYRQEEASSVLPSNQESSTNETNSPKSSEVAVDVEKAMDVQSKSTRIIETSGATSSRDTPEIVTSPNYLLGSARNGLLKPLNASTTKIDKIHHSSHIASKSVPLQKPIHIHESSLKKKRSRLTLLKRCSVSLFLTAVVCGYALGGAHLFCFLERRREIAYNAKIDKWKNDTAVLLATELRQVVPHEEVWARKVFQHLEIYERDLLRASAIGYRREDDDERGQRWTVKSALLFSISLMTTTGYGSMTPRSEWGRTAVVCFSLVGIPLFCSWVFILGHHFSLYWSWMFQNICCHMCTDTMKQYEKAQRKDSVKSARLRTNSVVPYEELKSNVKVGNPFARPEGIQNLNEILKSKNFPAQAGTVKPNQPRFVSKFIDQRHNKVVTYEESLQTSNKHIDLDNAVATVFAGLFLVVYFVFGSIAFALCHAWTIGDSLYFNYLMFMTQGPGCHEYESDRVESHIKQDVSYSVFLLLGYCLMSMFFHSFYRICNSARQK